MWTLWDEFREVFWLASMSLAWPSLWRLARGVFVGLRPAGSAAPASHSITSMPLDLRSPLFLAQADEVD